MRLLGRAVLAVARAGAADSGVTLRVGGTFAFALPRLLATTLGAAAALADAETTGVSTSVAISDAALLGDFERVRLVLRAVPSNALAVRRSARLVGAGGSGIGGYAVKMDKRVACNN